MPLMSVHQAGSEQKRRSICVAPQKLLGKVSRLVKQTITGHLLSCAIVHHHRRDELRKASHHRNGFPESIRLLPTQGRGQLLRRQQAGSDLAGRLGIEQRELRCDLKPLNRASFTEPERQYSLPPSTCPFPMRSRRISPSHKNKGVT